MPLNRDVKGLDSVTEPGFTALQLSFFQKGNDCPFPLGGTVCQMASRELRGRYFEMQSSLEQLDLCPGMVSQWSLLSVGELTQGQGLHRV